MVVSKKRQYLLLADEDLISLTAGGDTQALAALYDRHGRVAYSLGLPNDGGAPGRRGPRARGVPQGVAGGRKLSGGEGKRAHLRMTPKFTHPAVSSLVFR